MNRAPTEGAIPYNPDIHHRRSIRLRDYDYSGAGAYFVTICTRERECLFGEIMNGTVRLTEAGLAVVDSWQIIPHHFPHAALDEFVVMPNHVHGILMIDNLVQGAQFIAPNDQCTTMNQGAMNRAPTLGAIVRAFKARCTHAINALRDNLGVTVWQRNYFERVIRNDRELTAIRQYIADNPARWAEDENHPSRG